MGRGSSRELVQNIASALESEPKSIQDISEEIGADRKSVEKYLESLEKADIAGEREEGGNRTFYLKNWKSTDSQTYFDLPLPDETGDHLRSLFHIVNEEYVGKTGKSPSKLKAQKIAVYAAERTGLEIPHGGYRHGTMTVMSYRPEEEYKNTGLPGEDNVRSAVSEGVEVFSGSDFPEVKQTQYEQEDMKLYLVKEEISKQLASESGGDLQRNLYRFLSRLPPLDSEADEIVVDFVSLAPDLIEDYERAKLFETFQAVWDMVAIYRFYDDLREFYPEDILDNNLGHRMEEKKEEALDAVSALVDAHEPDHDIGELEELKGSAKELSEEEKEKREKELEDMDSSDIFGKFGINR